MPTASYRCPRCGHIRVLWRHQDRLDSPVYCISHRQHQTMERLIPTTVEEWFPPEREESHD